MNKPTTLTLTQDQHESIKAHLFPGDGKEAAVIALCHIAACDIPQRLLAKEIIQVPYDICLRSDVQLRWPTAWLDPLLDRAAAENLSLVKIHSHPNGYSEFSSADDYSDQTLFTSIHSHLETNMPHASCVMLPGGEMFGRMVDEEGHFASLDMISVIGHRLKFWPKKTGQSSAPLIGRQTKAFGREMVKELWPLSALIVGASGTGSIVIEELVRMGFGRVVLIDPDYIQQKNMDRILNAFKRHVRAKVPKVTAMKEAIEQMCFSTIVETYVGNLSDREAVKIASSCDIAFGCVDSAEGRSLLDRLSSSQLIPLFDVGVGLQADSSGKIDQIDGAINYVRPGGSSLLSRGVYNSKQVHDDILERTNPTEFAVRKKAKYVTGRDEDQPAVIPVNMIAAGYLVLELLARLYPFRHNENPADFATVKLNLAEMDIEPIAESSPCPVMIKIFATGATEPLLGLPLLGKVTK